MGEKSGPAWNRQPWRCVKNSLPVRWRHGTSVTLVAGKRGGTVGAWHRRVVDVVNIMAQIYLEQNAQPFKTSNEPLTTEEVYDLLASDEYDHFKPHTPHRPKGAVGLYRYVSTYLLWSISYISILVSIYRSIFLSVSLSICLSISLSINPQVVKYTYTSPSIKEIVEAGWLQMG